ncbi:MAG: family 78 glycoside hydrolase catalytic domain [Oscillospiraceae bacterium]|nr:family 78 glycoside hydrolase catalytic domain [Oscillospiraceae bacterium]
MTDAWNWITAADGADSPFYARRSFWLDAVPLRAVARVCGLGQFVFRVNGRKIGDHELDPGWTDYDKYAQYVTFDVTEALRPGENVLGAEVGNGWYRKNDEHYTFAFPPFMPPNPNPYRPYGNGLVLALCLELEYDGGRRETVGTDSGWTTAPHAIVQSNVYGSETFDASRYRPGWDAPGFDGSAWTPAAAAAGPKGELREQTQPPVKVIASYAGRYLHTVGGRDIYDFGQNMSGILEFTAAGPAGGEVRLYPAEKLSPEGDADQVAKNWCAVDSRITARLAGTGKAERFRMTFTYFAGRYVAVEHTDGAALQTLSAHAVSAAWKDAGSFHCDDERFNRIYDMIARTAEANLLSVHTDCPTIERFAWQEPNHLMAPSIFYMKDGKGLWEKYLTDLRLAQHGPGDFFLDLEGKPWYPGDGLVPSQAPCYIHNVLPVPGMGSFYDIIPWGSTLILGTAWHYLFYGDLSVVRDNYAAGLRYLDYLKTKLTPEGFICHGLGDWGNPENQLARENVETAFLYADAVTLARFALLLEKPEDAGALQSFAEELKAGYNEKLLAWNEKLGCWCYRLWDSPEEVRITQAAEALPLYWGMVPAEREADVAKAFRASLEEKGAFVSGEVGLPYVIQAARRQGWNELICRFVTREEHPSYYAFVLDGETTLGEYWERNPRSHCHDMMGHIIEWYYNGLAGIEPLEPGFRKVRIRPYLPEGMGSFGCSYETPLGTVRVRAKRGGDGLPSFEIETPPGIAVEH